MAEVYLDEKHFEDISEAIRKRSGIIETYTPGEMAQAILDLPTFDDGDTNLEDLILSGELVTLSSSTIRKIMFLGNQPNLEQVTCPNVIEVGKSGCFGNQPKLRVVGLDSLTAIPVGMFYNCPSLEYLKFPNVETISSYAPFDECTALKRIIVPKFMSFDNDDQTNYMNNYTPNFEAFVINRTIAKRGNMPKNFGDIPFSDSGKYYIYVPAEDLETYQSAFPSRSFRAIEDYPDIAGEVEA